MLQVEATGTEEEEEQEEEEEEQEEEEEEEDGGVYMKTERQTKIFAN
jgi:hypothetical protein